LKILVFSIIGCRVTMEPQKKSICILPIKNRVLSLVKKYWFGLFMAKLRLVKVHSLFPSHPHVENSHPLGRCGNILGMPVYMPGFFWTSPKISYPPHLHLSTYNTYYISSHVQLSPNCFTYFIMYIYVIVHNF
jgi:hypothetical protein